MIITKKHDTLLQQSEAIFSPCERYRYRLVRLWDESLPSICFLMLNPSTADAFINDATIERCQRRAIANGYGKMTIINLFPYRETDSKLLGKVEDLFCDLEETNIQIIEAVKESTITIAGWGNHPLATARAKQVYELLAENGLNQKLWALAVNNDGSPQHPLYISYSAEPKNWIPR